jgi:hypothetical protein
MAGNIQNAGSAVVATPYVRQAHHRGDQPKVRAASAKSRASAAPIA